MAGNARRDLALRLLRPYLWLLGGGLFGQGVLTEIFLAVDDRVAGWTHGILSYDARHGAIHIAWGTALLLMFLTGVGTRGLARGAVAFGVFYLALAVLGVVTHNPFGLMLGPGENVFHFIVGTSALLIGGVALWWPVASPDVEAASRVSGS